MSTDTLFTNAEWLSAGNKWGDIPAHVKHAGKQEFLIPGPIRAEILPSYGISVQEMLAFNLPNQTVTVNVIDPVNFFSRHAADRISEASLMRLRRLPIPTASVVGKLVEMRKQAWLDGNKSLRYIHLSNTVTSYFPLWLVSFWEAVLDLRKNVCKPWVAANEWLNAEIRQRRSAERRQLAGDARAFLAALPWDVEMVRTLWRFLGPHFTTGSQQDTMLDMLGDRIAARPDLAGRLHVKSLALSPKIMEAATGHETDKYATDQTFRYIRELGGDIASHKKSVLTLHHLGKDNPHFVAIVIDGESETINFGNSYGAPIPPNLLDAYQWWLSQHVSSPFRVTTLPITSQEPEDTSSCGFLADNSLQHFAFPSSVPLILRPGIQAARMKAFLLLAQQVLDQVCR
jgi:hypothetical protein